MRNLMGRLLVVLAFAGWGANAKASLLTFEEAGDLPGTGAHYFDTVGVFDFELIRCNCDNTVYRHGVALRNVVDSPNGWIPKLYNTPKNVVSLSHDMDVRMSLTSGGVFDLENAYLGNSHFQSPTLFLDGYLNDILIYELELDIPNILADAVGPALELVDIDMLNVDRVEWSMSSINIGSAVMDSFTYNAASVPTPATLALFSIGLAGLGCSRRKASGEV